jgi:hypothetical protein
MNQMLLNGWFNLVHPHLRYLSQLYNTVLLRCYYIVIDVAYFSRVAMC